MKDVVINEMDFKKEKGKGKGKVAIFIYNGSEDPTLHLDMAVAKYVGSIGYNEFIDANMDNPWIRIVLIGINDMPTTDYK